MVQLAPLIGPAIGFAGGLLGSSGPSAADRARAQTSFEAQIAQTVAQLEAIDAQKDVQRAQYARALEEYEYAKGQALEQYYYEVARQELLRERDAQQGLDVMEYNSKLIEAAATGFELQAAALEDQFINQEALRGTEVRTSYEQTQQVLAIRTNREVAGYLNAVQRNTAQMNQEMATATGTGKRLQNELVLEQALDEFRYHAGLITGAVESAREGNVVISQTGGSQSAKRVAADRMKNAYRQAGEVAIRTQSREARMSQWNDLLQNEVSARALQLSLASGRYAEQIAEEINLYETQFKANETILQDVTLPTFDLSQKQYMRELETLQLNTEAILDQATQPYRFAKFLDVPEPALGIKPEFLAPTSVYAPAVPEPPDFGSGPSFVDYAAGALTGLAPFANQLVQNLFNAPKGFNGFGNFSQGFSAYQPTQQTVTNFFNSPQSFGSFGTGASYSPSLNVSNFGSSGLSFSDALSVDLGL